MGIRQEPVVILAGGQGTRLREETEFRPKPMVEIGGKPILWHIMRNYAHFGFTEFIICVGYKGDFIRDYFLNFESRHRDFTVTLGHRDFIQLHGPMNEDGWKITVVETGSDTMTGGRVFQTQPYVGGRRFMCTYGDAVGNVDLESLLKFHEKHRRIASVTAVNLPSRFGVLEIQSEVVSSFREKPLTDDLVNAGFFVFEPAIFDFLNRNCVLEKEPLSQLAEKGELMAFEHHGYWQPMDTYRETLLLNELWASGNAPWRTW